jgi:hypothetical protein
MPMPAESLRQHADSYLNTLAPLYGPVRRLDQPHGYYRIHGENDFAGRPLDQKLTRNLAMYRYRCALLAGHAAREVTDDTLRAWNAHPYANLLQFRVETLRRIGDVVPAGASFVWMDGARWGRGEPITGRHSIPVARYPEFRADSAIDSVGAIARLERLREDGAGYAVFVKPAVWWITVNEVFSAHMRSRYPCVLDDPSVIVFDLRDAR